MTDQIPRTLLTQLRRVCRRLPELTEHESRGWPVFRVGRRTCVNVVAVSDRDGQVVTVITARAPASELDSLVASGHPFFKPRSASAAGWLGVVIDERTDWSEIREIVTDSYLIVAPKRLTATLDL